MFCGQIAAQAPHLMQAAGRLSLVLANYVEACGTAILLLNTNNATIDGNFCVGSVAADGSVTWDSSQYSIRLSGANNNYNLITNNNIPGKNYTSSGGTGNTFVNNKYN